MTAHTLDETLWLLMHVQYLGAYEVITTLDALCAIIAGAYFVYLWAYARY